jgi:hypothetical protein
MKTWHIVITAAAALTVLSAASIASAQAAPKKGAQQPPKTNGGAGTTKGKTEDADKGPVQSTSAQAAAHEDATAPTKAQAIPDVAPNTPAARFGARSQIAISSDAGLSIENTSLSGVDGSTTTVVLNPALDYFVLDNFSVGGYVGLNYVSTTGGSSTKFSVGPRVGYNIAFAERFSVWPKLGLSFASTSQKADIAVPSGGTTTQSTTNTAVAINLFVPLMFHPVEHFFLGFGPALDADLSGDNKSTTIGGRLTIGGWF